MQRALDLIERIVELAERPVLLVVIPDEIQVNATFRRTVFERFDLDEADYDWFGPGRRVLEIAERHEHATAIDLLPALREADREARTYSPNNTHWNARGHRVVAEQLRPFVRDLAVASARPSGSS